MQSSPGEASAPLHVPAFEIAANQGVGLDDRILDDSEIRVLWAAAEANGSFGAFVRLLLLTGQLREKVASMKWADVSIDGIWTIAAEEREKGHGGELELPAITLEIIKTRPRFADNPHVFAGRAGSHFSGYSKSKAGLDAKIELEPWTLHDLRRTARSLMSRAGVAPHVAELTIGHVQKGIVATYDRHSYRDEKADALRSGKTTFVRSILQQLQAYGPQKLQLVVVDGKGDTDYLGLLRPEMFPPSPPISRQRTWSGAACMQTRRKRFVAGLESKKLTFDRSAVDVRCAISGHIPQPTSVMCNKPT